mgnify:CR=1 FL=1
MKHLMKQTAYYADTDSYGVVWHGTYLRWMEQARVEFCREINLNLVDLMNNDIALPVTSIQIRYKASAKINENVVVETAVTKLSPLLITFTQRIKSEDGMKLYTEATVDVVAVHNDGKLYRRLPDILKHACEKVLEV